MQQPASGFSSGFAFSRKPVDEIVAELSETAFSSAEREFRELDRLEARQQIRGFVERVERGDGVYFGFTDAPTEYVDPSDLTMRASNRRENG